MRKETTSEALAQEIRRHEEMELAKTGMVHARGTAEGDIPLRALEASEEARKHVPPKDHDAFSEERVGDEPSYKDILKNSKGS